LVLGSWFYGYLFSYARVAVGWRSAGGRLAVGWRFLADNHRRTVHRLAVGWRCAGGRLAVGWRFAIGERVTPGRLIAKQHLHRPVRPAPPTTQRDTSGDTRSRAASNLVLHPSQVHHCGFFGPRQREGGGYRWPPVRVCSVPGDTHRTHHAFAQPRGLQPLGAGRVSDARERVARRRLL